MRTLCLACLLAATSTACGARLRIDSADTVGLPGFTTFTFLIETDPGEVLRGVDAEFRGPMSQVNPLGSPTIFNDSNGFIPFIGGLDVSQDSQFLFSSTDVLAIGAEESNTLLKAAISGLASLNLPNPTPIAQVAMSFESSFDFVYRLDFDLGGPEPVVFAGTLYPPEPTSATLLILGVMVGGMRRR